MERFLVTAAALFRGGGHGAASVACLALAVACAMPPLVVEGLAVARTRRRCRERGTPDTGD
ncbi:hypothetical protein [Actinomadura opuntiae]|uniref:hypothetical protein n=1 Tax=Actinomadura sp. OS1-43 TaxID=604315 RepID=UPI00255B045E|nr:hypothetical protein [Actinomadura sp. OS1-43]MDL4815153.1 hypothetical protein [Actinomadura sp. OS1-43]